MNANLANVKDGAGAGVDGDPFRQFKVMGSLGEMNESGEIYWPFAMAWDGLDAPTFWKVTHLPSGFQVLSHLRRRQALALIRELRALQVNLRFTRPKGQIWEAAKIAMRPIVKKYHDRNKR